MNNHPLHLKAIALSKNYIAAEKDLMNVLVEIDQKKLFRTFGYSSLFQYILSLGLTENQTYALITVSRKCDKIPALKAAIQSGSVSVSQARRVVAVISNESAPLWIEKARTLTSHALEKEVRAIRPKEIIPERIQPLSKEISKLTLPISNDFEKSLRRLQNVLSQKHQTSKTLQEVIYWSISESLAKYDPIEKAQRNVGKNTCTKLGPDLGRMVNPVRKTASHTKKTNAENLHSVNNRDKGCCQAKLPNGEKCLSERFIEIHHIVPRSLGGVDSVENLITLCSNHHAWAHGK